MQSTVLYNKAFTTPNYRLSIVIPTHNERDNLPDLLNCISQKLGKLVDYEVVVVDDDSSDGTLELLNVFARQYTNIKIVSRPAKLGISSALIDGFRVSSGLFLGVIDGDMQHPPEILPQMYEEAANGADLVIASRYTDGGRTDGWSSWRRVVSRVATYLAYLIPNVRLTKDPLSGCFVFKRGIVDVAQLEGIGCKLLLEILAKGRHRKVVDVPYVFGTRANGKSKLSFKECLDFLRLFFKLLRNQP